MRYPSIRNYLIKYSQLISIMILTASAFSPIIFFSTLNKWSDYKRAIRYSSKDIEISNNCLILYDGEANDVYIPVDKIEILQEIDYEYCLVKTHNQSVKVMSTPYKISRAIKEYKEKIGK